MHIFWRLAPALLSVNLMWAQAAAPAQFEVASVKPSAPGPPDQVRIGIHIDGARVSCELLSLREYIRIAYKVKDYQISAPEWMRSQRFDIAATLPAGASQQDVPDMLRALLAERFGLKLHRENKEFAVYALTAIPGGVKMKESPLDDAPAGARQAPIDVAGSGGNRGVSIDFGRGASFSLAANKVVVTKLTMASMADTLARFEDRPVVDLTGLTATYDLQLNLADEDYLALLIRAGINSGVAMPPAARQAMEAASGDSLNRALQTVGLKMESRKAPLEVLAIDHAEKVPTEN